MITKMALTIWQDGSQAYPSDVVLYDRLALVYHENGDYASEQNVLVKRLIAGIGCERAL